MEIKKRKGNKMKRKTLNEQHEHKEKTICGQEYFYIIGPDANGQPKAITKMSEQPIFTSKLTGGTDEEFYVVIQGNTRMYFNEKGRKVSQSTKPSFTKDCAVVTKPYV